MEKRLYRSRRDKMICGVCGGIFAYIVAAIIMPEEPYVISLFLP